jgi:hypothetical protein
MAESDVIGAIGGQLKGRWRRKPYTMVLTPDRTVFARRSAALQKQVVAEARAASKERGGGWLSQVRDQMGAHLTFHERYYSMDSDEILAEDEKNQSISNRDVRAVSVRNPQTVYDDEGGFTTHEARLKLETPRKTYTFDVESNMPIAEVRDLLTEAFGHRVR